jgi:hypothetical protein
MANDWSDHRDHQGVSDTPVMLCGALYRWLPKMARSSALFFLGAKTVWV